MSIRKEENVEITEDVIKYIVNLYDEIGQNPRKGYDKILIAFKEIEKRGIQELYYRMYKAFPYTANSKTALSTDASPAKIRRFVNN